MAKGKTIEKKVQEGVRPTVEREPIEPTILERVLAERGISSRRFKNEYGIDPSKIMRYRENPDGSKTFLCYEETPDGLRFYTLRASEKTSDWKQAVREYQGE